MSNNNMDRTKLENRSILILCQKKIYIKKKIDAVLNTYPCALKLF